MKIGNPKIDTVFANEFSGVAIKCLVIEFLYRRV